MDVQVKLWLQGGHTWEFCCDEEDPILFGLMSALADTANLPPDGLIQLNTRTGERIFLTRSSLVSVALVPIIDELQPLHANRLVTLSDKSTNGPSSPAPFTIVPDALPDETHRALIRHALAQGAAAQQQAQNGVCELSLSPMEAAVATAFRSHVDKRRAELSILESARTHIRCGLFAIGNGKAISWHREADEILSFVYHFHQQPKVFTGGGIRLFDCRIDNGVSRAADSFRDVEIKDNSVLIFPAHVISAGLPVYCATRAFADGLFVLRGSIRQEPASD